MYFNTGIKHGHIKTVLQAEPGICVFAALWVSAVGRQRGRWYGRAWCKHYGLLTDLSILSLWHLRGQSCISLRMLGADCVQITQHCALKLWGMQKERH